VQLVNKNYLRHLSNFWGPLQTRVKAKLYAKIEDKLVADIDSVKHELEQQSKLQDAIAEHETDIKLLCTELEQTPKKVQIKDMPSDGRYNKLKS
jgi:hypothetical protein